MSLPGLIALDWGTTSLRAFLLDTGGAVLDSRSGPHGIMQVAEGGFPEAFRTVAGAWREAGPALPALACGMVGSAQGWREAPYRFEPAGAAELGAALVAVDSGDGGLLHIVPGLAQRTPQANVMRGEETQILGALSLRPGFGDDACLLLPGTHSKWASIRGGRVSGFETFMTGELFALLREHSILGRPSRGLPAAAAAESDRAFDAGVDIARAAPDGVMALLFSARSRVLLGELPPAASLDYLSGLLIGDEIRSGLHRLGTAEAGSGGADGRFALIGDPGLCDRYRRAFRAFGHRDVPSIETATVAGLWRIAVQAGLVATIPAAA